MDLQNLWMMLIIDPMVEEADTGGFLGLNGWPAYPTEQTVVNEKLLQRARLLRNTAHKDDLWSLHTWTQIPAPNILSVGRIYFDSESLGTSLQAGHGHLVHGRGSLWLPILTSSWIRR